MNNWMTDLKMYLLSVSTLAISLTQVDMALKIMLLLVSIGYTLHKWNLLRGRNKNEEDK